MAILERSETVSIADILSGEVIDTDLDDSSRDEVFESLVDLLVEAGRVSDREQALSDIREREEILSTGIGNGVAIPHAKSGAVHSLVGAFGRVEAGVDFKSLDGKPAYLIFLLISPEEEAGHHVRALSRVSRMLKNAHFRERLMEASRPQDVLEIIREEEETF